MPSFHKGVASFSVIDLPRMVFFTTRLFVALSVTIAKYPFNCIMNGVEKNPKNFCFKDNLDEK